MAYDALIPLDMTICRLANSVRVSIESPTTREILVYAHQGVEVAIHLLHSLERFRERIDRRKIKALDEEMRRAAWQLEDVLDSRVSDQFVLQSETQGCSLQLVYSLDLQEIRQDVVGFTQKMEILHKVFDPWADDGISSDIFRLSDQSCLTRTMFINGYAARAASLFTGTEEDYIKDLDNILLEEEEAGDYDVLLTSDFSESKSKDLYHDIRDALFIWWVTEAASAISSEEKHISREILQEEEVVSLGADLSLDNSDIVGLTGLFCQIRDHVIRKDDHPFSIRVANIIGTAGIGKTAIAEKIFHDPLVSNEFECRIFVKMGPEYQFEEIMQSILAQLNPESDQIFAGGEMELEEYLYKTFMARKCLIVLDDVWNQDLWADLGRILPYRGRVCFVLVTTRINKVAINNGGMFYFVPFLNEEQSWDLFCRKIFGEKRCPYELEKPGKKIAENCEGLPLLILTVADLLSKAEMTLEYWSKIASNKTNSIFVTSYEQIYEVVYPSYYYLPLHLQTCFLYMGAFPQNDVVRMSKLINLWSAEGFLGSQCNPLHQYVEDYFDELVSYNVALDSQRSSLFFKLKNSTLHSVFWYLSKKEGWKDKFLHVLNSYTDASLEDIQSRRRLSVYKNVIFSVKDVRDSIATMSSVRSLLCTGPPDQYQVPIHFELMLLKVLDALTIRFYEFPLEVLKLIHLRYLALTSNGNLPPSIFKLWNLQCLILHKRLSIKYTVCQSYVPVEIWHLEELEYLQIVGRNLPDPPAGAVLPNLMTLLDVGPETCTKRVVESMPNLQKLRVQIELMPDGADSQKFYDAISHLKQVRSLQCVVMNPNSVFASVSQAPLVCGSLLTKLTLSGFGYPWESIKSIAELASLQELKLKCYAFQGGKWQVKQGEFRNLRYLLIEDTDLVLWTGDNYCLPQLHYLTIKHCYKLKDIPELFLVDIRVVDCNPSIATRAKLRVPHHCRFHVKSSWLDNK